jgi:hypothetical protein
MQVRLFRLIGLLFVLTLWPAAVHAAAQPPVPTLLAKA